VRTAVATIHRKEVTGVTQLAYKEATVKPVKEIAAELQELLGQKLVAYGVGVNSPKLVGRWAAGDHDPRDDTATRLRVLYRVVRTLQQHYEPSTIRAFLMGANPDLQDRAPIDVIREDQGAEVVRAAEVFLDA
jgi:hypothetical protein